MDILRWRREEIFGMQLNDFNKIRMEIGRKIKQSFGNKIRGMEFYDIVEKTGHWSFKICFIAYILQKVPLF